MITFFKRFVGIIINPSRTLTDIASDPTTPKTAKTSGLIYLGYVLLFTLYGIVMTIQSGDTMPWYYYLVTLVLVPIIFLLPLYILHKLAYFESGKFALDKLAIVFIYVYIITDLLSLVFDFFAGSQEERFGFPLITYLLGAWGFVVILIAVERFYELPFRKSLRLYVRMFVFILLLVLSVLALLMFV